VRALRSYPAKCVGGERQGTLEITRFIEQNGQVSVVGSVDINQTVLDVTAEPGMARLTAGDQVSNLLCSITGFEL
jgi:hypothetical protein